MAEQPQPAATSPVRPVWLGGDKKNLVWKWTWRAKDGYQESAVSRGPATQKEMEEAAYLILDGMTKSAIDSGADDPGLTIVSIEPAGKDDAPLGAFRPAGGKALNPTRFNKPTE